MSLLLDALKRAEQEKLARQGARPEGERAGEPQVPAPAPAAAPAARPASLELQPLGSAPPGAATPAAANSPRAEANAAQNMFSAKAAPGDGPRKSPLLWIGLVALIVIVAAAGGYVWFTTQAFTPRLVASARPRPAPITPAPATTPLPAPQIGAFVPTQQPTAAIQPPAAPTPAAPAPEEIARPAASASPGRVQDEVARLLRESSRAPGPAPVKLSPSREMIHVPADVARGYRELAAGNYGAARPAYRAALEADPANLDALLGMATLEALGGNRYAAAAFYQRALAVDPRNATAQAGLAALDASERPEGQESRLASAIALDPQSPQLHFALGNLFASQSRWNEAQVQYFEAFRLDPASADLAYNLAVSLDHLHQPRLAAEYYARAIEAARVRASQFDPAAAARRLAQIRG
ncbi:MAG TPA: tetratricopeptide repeat protein [Usitatibacter sp.]|nr:tetratricopeptide repeat protein [Usitatibacter sp.]